MDSTESRLRQLTDEELDAELGRVLRALRGSVPDRSALRAVATRTPAPGHARPAPVGTGTVDVADLLRRQALLSRELRRRRESAQRPPDAAPQGAVVLAFRPRR